MPHIRKHHSTINEEEEIYEIVKNGLVVWFGYGDGITELLGTPDWACGDDITYYKDTDPMAPDYAALAAEEPVSQIEDSRESTGLEK